MARVRSSLFTFANNALYARYSHNIYTGTPFLADVYGVALTIRRRSRLETRSTAPILFPLICDFDERPSRTADSIRGDAPRERSQTRGESLDIAGSRKRRKPPRSFCIRFSARSLRKPIFEESTWLFAFLALITRCEFVSELQVPCASINNPRNHFFETHVRLALLAQAAGRDD